MRLVGRLALLAAVSLSSVCGAPKSAPAQDAWVFANAVPCASAPVYGLPFSACSISNTRAFRNGKIQSWRLTFSDAKSEVAVGLYRIVDAQGGGGMSPVSGSGVISWLQTAEALRSVTSGASSWALISGDYVTFQKGQRQCVGFVRNAPAANWTLGGALCREAQSPLAVSEAQFIADAVKVRE
jgi:hypothetical protein